MSLLYGARSVELLRGRHDGRAMVALPSENTIEITEMNNNYKRTKYTYKRFDSTRFLFFSDEELDG